MGGSGPSTLPRAPDGIRSRVESPPCDTIGGSQPVWGSAWLRELTVDEALLKSELDGADLRDLMNVHEDEEWPSTALVEQIEAQVCATSAARKAANAKWQDKAFGSMVLTRHLARLVANTRQTVEHKYLEKMRDGLIEVFPWT